MLRCGWREVAANDDASSLSHPTYGHCTKFPQKGQLDIWLLLDGLHLVWYDCPGREIWCTMTMPKEKGAMSEIVASCVYFSKTGPVNTARTLELACARAGALGIRKVLVATTTGATAARATRVLQGLEVIAVTHSTGFGKPIVSLLSVAGR